MIIFEGVNKSNFLQNIGHFHYPYLKKYGVESVTEFSKTHL